MFSICKDHAQRYLSCCCFPLSYYDKQIPIKHLETWVINSNNTITNSNTITIIMPIITNFVLIFPLRLLLLGISTLLWNLLPLLLHLQTQQSGHPMDPLQTLPQVVIQTFIKHIPIWQQLWRLLLQLLLLPMFPLPNHPIPVPMEVTVWSGYTMGIIIDQRVVYLVLLPPFIPITSQITRVCISFFTE